MPKIVDVDLATRGRGRPEKYPWDEWTDGLTRLFTRGDDFECSPAGFVSAAAAAAKRRGLVLHSLTEGDGVYLSFHKKGGEER